MTFLFLKIKYLSIFLLEVLIINLFSLLFLNLANGKFNILPSKPLIILALLSTIFTFKLAFL